MGLIDYTTMVGDTVPNVSAALLEYATAGTGLYVRARRDVCQVTIPVAEARIPGLADLEPGMELLVPKVRRAYLERVFDAARRACIAAGTPVEYLCYLAWNGLEWEYLEPEQEAGPTSVRPVGAGLADHARATVEIHSHHEMRARFSGVDDADEGTGFRIYGVVGRIFSKPEISLRVGCHGHFLPIEACDLFEGEETP